MRITYSPEADAAYIYLVPEIKPGGVKMTYLCDPLETKGMINLDFDCDGRLIGIEVLGASRKLPAKLLEEAGH